MEDRGGTDDEDVTTLDNQVSKHERAYRLIRARIIDGAYPPGHRLVIDALAEELGISQVPVREAIRRLEAEGRIEYRHNIGARVAPASEPRQVRIGVDVGHTSTDAVVMSGGRVVVAAKLPATADVTAGIAAAIEQVTREGRVAPASIEAVLIGTTHFANAFEKRQLAASACIRLGLPATEGLPPMADWPAEARAAADCRCYLAHGGHHFDGRTLSPLRPDELRRIAADLQLHDIQSVAVSAVFSPVSGAAELEAAEILRAALPEVAISLSHRIGRLGLLERENAAIINACLRPGARGVLADLRAMLRRLGIAAPLYLTQNDGTLMTGEHAERFPVLTFSSGHANSIRGAAFLTGLRDAVVIDAGGGAMRIGALVDGFPREATAAARVGGVRTNSRMPDLVKVPIGGDSVVTGPPWGVGPDSVGSRLRDQALVFGGDTVTLTDVAVAAGLIALGDPNRAAHLRAAAPELLEILGLPLRRAVQRAGAISTGIPLIVIGGSAPLANAALAPRHTVIPEQFAVANAVGAAMAPVSGEVDRIVSLEGVSRQETLALAVSEAVGQAVAAGADPASVRVAWAEDAPLTYLPGNVTRVRVKAFGALGVGAAHDR
jgi:N-methylhydantoinase A/oxoprolinase/acetone carboxylase beta subunit